MVQDFRQALRLWRRDPRFFAVAALTLTLGIAATTAVFSVVHGILLRPFAYQEPDRLAVVWERNQGRGLPRMFASPPNFHDWARESRSFASMAAYNEEELTLETESAERVYGAAVSASLLPLLGVEPMRGRVFLPEEDREGAVRVVVVSHGFWQRRLGGDPGAIGKTVTLDSETHTIVGIMPEEFSFPPPVTLEGNASARTSELWVPLRLDYASGQRGALSGVASVGAVNELPLAHDRQGTSFSVEGEEKPPQGQEPRTAFAVVSPKYFEALGVPLIQGRVFDAGDRVDSPPVVVVNQTFARRYFGDGDPIGKRIALGMSTQTVREIVGIVGDVRHQAVATEVVPNVYAPYLQYPRSFGVTFVLATEASPENLSSPVRQALAQVDPALPVFDLRTFAEVVGDSISQPRFESALLFLFSLAALLLAAVGLYGLVSYSVSRRIPEIGLRMALGADASSVRNLVVGEGARLAFLGSIVGLAGSIALGRFLSSLLFGVGASDPATYGAATISLFLAALAAAYLPARRAMRVAPIEALRYE